MAKRKTLTEIDNIHNKEAYYANAMGVKYLANFLHNINYNSYLVYDVFDYMFEEQRRVHEQRIAAGLEAAEENVEAQEEVSDNIVGIEEYQDKTIEQQQELYAEQEVASELLKAEQVIEMPQEVRPAYTYFEDASKAQKINFLKIMADNSDFHFEDIDAQYDSRSIANLNKIADGLKLTDAEREYLKFVYTYTGDRELRMHLNSLAMDHNDNYIKMVSAMTGISKDDMRSFLTNYSKLRLIGFVKAPEQAEERGRESYLWPILDDTLFDNLSTFKDKNIQILVDGIIGKEVDTDLSWDEDFSHLPADNEYFADLLDMSVRSGTKGNHFLFVGDSGLGKRQAARAMAKNKDVKLLLVGESDDEQTRVVRLRKLMMATDITKGRKDCAILVENAEDILSLVNVSDEGLVPYGRNYLTNLLKNNDVPIICTVNSTDGIHKDVLSNFKAINFRVPSAPDRARILKKACDKEALKLPAKDIEDISNRYKASAAILTEAAANAKKILDRSAKKSTPSYKKETIENGIKSAANSVFGSYKAIEVRGALPSNYDVNLVNAEYDDEPIGELISTLKEVGDSDFRMLMYGEAGTSKTSTGHFIANQLGLECETKTASDIMDMYQGNTEKNIAKIFEEFEREGKVLIIDEVESLLQDRGNLDKAYEKSQVNELLTQLDKASFPVIFTTNHKDTLDGASIRRIDLKIKCNYLRKDQYDLAYSKFFKGKVPKVIHEIDDLGLGDFKNVKRQLRFSKDKSPANIAKKLAYEVDQRNGKSGSTIGFGAKGKDKNVERVTAVIAAKGAEGPRL